jgi:hypothetical protein
MASGRLACPCCGDGFGLAAIHIGGDLSKILRVREGDKSQMGGSNRSGATVVGILPANMVGFAQPPGQKPS